MNNKEILKKIVQRIKERVIDYSKNTLGIKELENKLNEISDDKSLINEVNNEIKNINNNSNNINLNAQFNINDYIKLNNEYIKTVNENRILLKEINNLKNKIFSNKKEIKYVSEYEFDKLQEIGNEIYLYQDKEIIFGYGKDKTGGIITYSEYKNFLHKKYIIRYNDSLSFQNFKIGLMKDKDLDCYINAVIVNDRVDFVVKK